MTVRCITDSGTAGSTPLTCAPGVGASSRTAQCRPTSGSWDSTPCGTSARRIICTLNCGCGDEEPSAVVAELQCTRVCFHLLGSNSCGASGTSVLISVYSSSQTDVPLAPQLFDP